MNNDDLEHFFRIDELVLLIIIIPETEDVFPCVSMLVRMRITTIRKLNSISKRSEFVRHGGFRSRVLSSI